MSIFSQQRISRTSCHAHSSRQYRPIDVQPRLGTQRPDGAAAEPRAVGQPAGRQHHGQQADDEHHALRHVPQSCQPNGRGGNGGSLGCVDTDALHTQYPGTLDAGRANGSHRQYAGARQHLQTDVSLGRYDPGGEPGSGHQPDSVTQHHLPVQAACTAGYLAERQTGGSRQVWGKFMAISHCLHGNVGLLTSHKVSR